jgi:hypothetical protein
MDAGDEATGNAGIPTRQARCRRDADRRSIGDDEGRIRSSRGARGLTETWDFSNLRPLFHRSGLRA